MDFTNKKVGRYEIKDLIGSGAMADVYKTYDPEIDRVGAIKILKDSLLGETEYLNRFLKESRAAGTLTHPNIVTIFDIGKVNDLPFIVMELLEGEMLTDMMRRNERLPFDTIIDMSMQIALALDYAHSQGVVHRDIKPDNIIYDASKNSIKIADFGIAKRLDADAQDSTQAGMIMGTPRYMSPEQAKGEKIDGRADLFALGVILYELVTRKKAFDAKSLPTLIIQIIQKDPEPIKLCAPDVPVGLQGIINRLIQKKPEKRFQSGKQLYDALVKELRTIQDHHEQEGYIPMQVRWTAIMGLMVGVVMLISSVLVTNVQSKLLTDQAINGGVSLATFIASESAVPLLSQDWIGLSALSEEAFKRKSFDYLSITDHNSVVRSTTDKTLSGDVWKGEGILISARQDVSVFDVKIGDNKMFIFDTPIRFNETTIGRVNLGVFQGQLTEVMSETRRIMAILALAVVLAVLLIVYFFNRLIQTNLLVVRRAIRDLSEGNESVRISRKWKNEFGSLANNFNALAEKLQYQTTGEKPVSETEVSEIPEADPQDIAVEEVPKPAGDHPTSKVAQLAPVSSEEEEFAEFTVVQNTPDDKR